MKNKFALLFAITFISFLLSCQKEATRIPDFWREFATVEIIDANISFILDNGSILKPQEPISFDLENGSRVIIDYTPIEGEFIKINSIRSIFMGAIQEEGYPEKVKTSPIKIKTIWVSGHFLNISFEVDYHSKPHITGLYRDIQESRPTLYFSYSREDDPPGAPTLTYLSFDLRSLENNEPFSVYVNTNEGEREFNFSL